ncbi:hypothetical protein KNP414_00782 [Paenibacillus mucilaginosus KNP414]|uniref:Uncharacterized protein n=1 Tax=Paenibacillus mucilaginosus (strain KNP414) TaxID=1036673 RepID=F8FRC2_PAEMK|nr:hypothetical protein KNP414_00782 [Paenibacillus mucilaginosus KNP414]
MESPRPEKLKTFRAFDDIEYISTGLLFILRKKRGTAIGTGTDL